MKYLKANLSLMALQATCAWFLMLQPCLAQNELWVLNETPPSLGRIDLTSFNYEELLSFDNVSYATDLEIQGDMAVVVLENRVIKVDLTTGETLADVELLGAQEAALLEDGTVVVTRGGLDADWQPLDLTSFLVWLDGADLALEAVSYTHLTLPTSYAV